MIWPFPLRLLRNRPSLSDLVSFTGRQTTVALLLGILAGVGLFVLEFCMAYVVQAFLLQVGLIKAESSQIPPWMLSISSLNLTLVLIVLVGTLRSFFLWLQVYLQSSAFEVQRDVQRRRLIRWAMSSKSLSGGRFFTLFNDRSQGTGNFYTQVQMVFTLLPMVGLLLVGLFYFSPVITGGALFVLGVSGFGFRALNARITRIADDFCAELALINERALGNIKNLLLMQIYGTTQKEERLITEALDRVFVSNMRYQRLFGLRYTIPQVVGLILICLITAVTIKFKLMLPGLMLSYFYLFIRFANSFSDLVRNWAVAMFQWPQARDMYQWWSSARHEMDLDSRLPPAPPPLEPLHGIVGWKLESVTFRYPEAAQPVIRNFSLTINPGDFLLITGESGAGKSTLLHLLLGIISHDEGSIDVLLDGATKQIPIASLRDRLVKSIGYVGTECFLREGTIEENLKYGLDHPVTETELWDSLAKAECQFVRELPLGLKHFITEQGQGLSAGQKQRLGLARALLRKPSILVLDEATSNLDVKTEASLISSLAKLKGTVTIVAVSHRGGMQSLADRQILIEVPVSAPGTSAAPTLAGATV